MIHHSGMVKVADGVTALELALPSNRSALITDIHLFVDAAQAEDTNVSIDNKRIFQFKAPSPWQLLAEGITGTLSSIFSVIRKAGLFAGIPVGPGEKLTIAEATPDAGNFVEIEYDLGDADDFPTSGVNGSASPSYQLFQVVSNAAVVTAAGDVPLDVSDLESMFPAFPGGEVVPSNTTMLLRAIFGGPWARGDASDPTQFTTRLKFLKDREGILSDDMLGMMFRGDASIIATAGSYLTDGSSVQIPVAGQDAKIKVFDPPIEFEAGKELNVYTTVAEPLAANGDTAIGSIKLGMLFDVIRS